MMQIHYTAVVVFLGRTKKVRCKCRQLLPSAPKPLAWADIDRPFGSACSQAGLGKIGPAVGSPPTDRRWWWGWWSGWESFWLSAQRSGRAAGGVFRLGGDWAEGLLLRRP